MEKYTLNLKSRVLAPTTARGAILSCFPPGKNLIPIVDGLPFMIPPKQKT